MGAEPGEGLDSVLAGFVGAGVYCLPLSVHVAAEMVQDARAV